jgi:hypothetical protein
LITFFKNTTTLYLFVCLFIIPGCNEQKDPPTKILVESRTTKYKYVSDKLDSTGTLYERILYDKLGRDSIIENYDGSGSLYLKTVLHYDSAGNKIRSIDYKANGKLESKTEFKYTTDGQILARNREHINGGYNLGKFIYNDRRERIKEIWTTSYYIDHLGEWFTSEVILLRSFNEKGYCIGVKESADGKPFEDKKTVFDSLGHIVYEDWGDNFRKFKYDENGNQIEELSLDKNKKLLNRWVSVYDSNNVRIEYITYNSLNEPVEVLKKKFIYKYFSF